MNNNINIEEILRNCPKGMKLYSSIFGVSEFNRIDNAVTYPIVIRNENNCTQNFTCDGRYIAGITTAESVLFPSSEMRDWTKFFKRGDIVIKNGGGMAAVFDGWANDTYTEFNTTINLYCDGNTGEEEVCTTLLFRKATVEERKQLIKKAERILNGKYNPDTLQVEPVKPKCPFKPFDKVLVRDNDEGEWYANYFSHYKENNDCPYVCIDNSYIYCIPYEGNEHLLGTSEAYTEGGSE